ncbi:replicative DNA helicase [Clostridium sardiniense]|uniref:replicative DNA helicase n=1 Tax=Clostridium sardiniense TaxID=29369 RepID=UPI003D349771
MEIKNIEAEVEVLGAMIYKNSVIPKCIESLKEEDFYLDKHKRIYRAIITLYGEGKDISLITLIEEISRKVLEKFGGVSYLTELMGTGTVVNIDSYIGILKDKSYRRRLIKCLHNGIRELQDETSNLRKITSQIEVELMENYTSKRSMLNENQLFSITLDHIEERYVSGGGIAGMKTGFIKFDNAVNGLQKGELAIIGGRPSMGKTAMALIIAEGLADNGNTVGIFEMEMNEESIGTRRLAANANIKADKIKKAILSEAELLKITDVFNEVSKRGKIFTDCTSGQDMLNIRAKSAALKMAEGLDAIIIDHLGLMDMGRTDNRTQAIGDVTRALKILAKELDINVILLCQLSRAVEQRSCRRPRLSDLRESGNIEQDADLVIFVYRDAYYEKSSDEKDIMEWIISKQRNGRTGILKFRYLESYQRIENIV